MSAASRVEVASAAGALGNFDYFWTVKFYRMTKRLTKSSNNRMIAGVCAGVANYFDVDPTVVRIAWAFLVVLFGSGLLLYLICWLLMPSDYGV